MSLSRLRFQQADLEGVASKNLSKRPRRPVRCQKALAPVGTAPCQHFFVGKKARKSLSSALCAPFQGDVRIRCDYRALSNLSQPLRYINDFHCLAISQRYRPASPLCAMVRKGNCNKLLLHMPAGEVDTSAIASAVLDSSTQVRNCRSDPAHYCTPSHVPSSF